MKKQIFKIESLLVVLVLIVSILMIKAGLGQNSRGLYFLGDITAKPEFKALDLAPEIIYFTWLTALTVLIIFFKKIFNAKKH